MRKRPVLRVRKKGNLIKLPSACGWCGSPLIGDGGCATCAAARDLFNEVQGKKQQNIETIKDCTLEINYTKCTLSVWYGKHIKVKLTHVPPKALRQTMIELRLTAATHWGAYEK